MSPKSDTYTVLGKCLGVVFDVNLRYERRLEINRFKVRGREKER